MSTARTFAEQAAANSAEFIKLGKPADFVEHLQQLATIFRASISGSDSATDNRIAETSAVSDKIQLGLDIVHDLDNYVHNQCKDKQFLAMWKSASHVERASRQSPAPPEPAPTKEPAKEPVTEIEPAK